MGIYKLNFLIHQNIVVGIEYFLFTPDITSHSFHLNNPCGYFLENLLHFGLFCRDKKFVPFECNPSKCALFHEHFDPLLKEGTLMYGIH